MMTNQEFAFIFIFLQK